MSSFAWMKVLESSAERYDRGIDVLSGGRIGEVYRRVAALAVGGDAPGLPEDARRAAQPGSFPGAAARGSPTGVRRPRVLDIGCGTGGVTLACARRGADAVGIDRNAAMLEVARTKVLPDGAGGCVTWLELGAAEIQDHFGPAAFDAIVSCLAFSEMSEDERAYTLRTALIRLVPGGRLVLADEVEPASRGRRTLRRVAAAPVQALVYLLTQARTRPVAHLPELVEVAGFVGVREERLWGDTFAIVTANAPPAVTATAGGGGQTADPYADPAVWAGRP